jgi:hypothetical protein
VPGWRCSGFGFQLAQPVDISGPRCVQKESTHRHLQRLIRVATLPEHFILALTFPASPIKPCIQV